MNRAGAVVAAAGDHLFAVRREVEGENPTRHRRELADEVRVVADHALGHTRQPENLRHTVRATDEHFLFFRVHRDGVDAALECARSDGGDVVYKPRGGHLGQFHRHVAANRDKVIALVIPDRVQHPVIVVIFK